MLEFRRAHERGHAQYGWLESFHTFSFAGYVDPRQMGFRALRVINEDRVKPGKGVGTHSHRDMEILSDLLEGALEHKDVSLYATLIDAGDSVEHALSQDRYAWVQVTRGELEVNGHPLGAGDGVALSDESVVSLSGLSAAKALLFDLC